MRTPSKTPTRRQLDALAVIVAGVRRNGHPPTMREICDALRISSTNAVSDLLGGLTRHGYIKRSGSASRGIVVLRLPDGTRIDGWAPMLEVLF